MYSKLYGEISIDHMAQIIKDYIESDKESEYTVSVGTDSQNHQLTKIVVAVAVHKHGKGGIFFYDIKYEKLIKSIKQKIYFETSLSLEIAGTISKYFALNNIEQDIEIHVDIGKNRNGKTYELIQEITGWVIGTGYKCEIKPNSYTASSIADRLSK